MGSEGSVQNGILDLSSFETFISNALRGYEYAEEEPFWLIWTDLEHFGTYNEQQGFLKGNKLLEDFGQILMSQFMDGAIGRIAGVHFAVLTNAPDVERRLLLVHDILQEQPLMSRVDFKAGVVRVPKDAEDLPRLFEMARAACRRVAGKAGNYIGYYAEDMDRSIVLQDYIPAHFQEAMDKHAIHVVYQPIVRTVTGKVCGMEALARWDDPVFGAISPAEFVPVLEKRRMVHRLDDHIVRLVAEDYSKARDAGRQLCPASINLSRYDFEDGDIFETFAEMADSHRIPRGWFRIEITESALMVQHDLLKSSIASLRDHGFEIWMDNFGSGYASLNALEDFDFDVVKCDIHFMRDFRSPERSQQARTILSGLTNMLKELKLHTLVMGLETKEEWDYLHSIGCEMLQGYYIGKPQTLEEILSRRPEEIEDFSERKYYEVLGAIKIDNALPGEGGTRKHSARQVEPMAVLEYTERRYNFLFYNASFLYYLRELGVESAEEAEQLLNMPSGVMQQHLREFAEHVVRLESDIHFNVVLRGKLIDVWADYLATNQETGAIAFVVYNSLITERGRSRNQDFEDAMRAYYNVFDRMDLVRRKDGVIVRSYLNTAEYGSLHEGQAFDKFLQHFEEEYISEEDSARFRAFTDLGTLDQRARESRRGLVSESFTTRMDSGEKRQKQYSLLPMTLHGQQFLLFALMEEG